MSFFSNWLRADVYKEPASGVEFPGQVGNYKRDSVTPYEAEPGKTGVAINYRAEDAVVTVYVRTLGNETSKTGADMVEETLAATKELEKRGKYSNVKIYEFDPGKEVPGWKTASFTSGATNQLLMSIICCKVIPGNMGKIRASTNNPKNDAMISFIKTMQDAVDATLKK